jgi:hypothetical protein
MKLKNLISHLLLISTFTSMGWANLNTATAQFRGDLRGDEFFDDFQDPIDQRAQELILNIGGEVFGSHAGRSNGTLFLKHEIQRRHPHLALDQIELEIVTVVGNSEARRASSSTLTLVVGGRVQDSARLGLQGQNRRHADVAELFVRDVRASAGRGVTWQVEFDAATRVDQVVVQYTIERRPPPVRLRSLGILKAHKAIILPVTLNVNDEINTLHIRGVNRTVNIERIEATLHNGRRILLNLRGSVRPDQVLKENFRHGLDIQSIEIHATSMELIGSRGEYEVLVGSARRR